MQTVNVCAPGVFDYYDSYGLIACQLARHLARLGVRVHGFGLGGERIGTTPPDVAALLEQPISPSLGGIMLGYPIGGDPKLPLSERSGYHRHLNPLIHIGPQVALTMFESSRCPADWIPVLNRMAAVITPSRFCRDLFAGQGVHVPIHVIPLGVSEIYRPAPRPADRPFTFLTFLDRGARKGGLAVLQAFRRAFGDDTDYRLIIKSRTPRQQVNITNPNVLAVQRDMSEAELYTLYLECDAFVSAATGEGFGLIPREFAATGGISITANWSGTADDIDLWGVPLPYTMERADWSGHEWLSKLDLGEWARVGVDALVETMRRVADNREAYQARAARNAERVAALYDWSEFARHVWQVWQSVTAPRQIALAAD